MVSNYQLLQTIYSISDNEYRSRQEIKTSEQFSPIVTIVDAATKQPLDCVLLLHGQKPPEVSSETLFCYIAIQVTHIPYYDAHGSNPHPLYHVKSNPCKQGKLPLIFCFHQPGTVCVIQLSIHSISDSEGVEYMYHSEDCTCVVQIIDRVQHGGVKTSNQHGVVRIKEPPLRRYIGPLTTPKYHKLESKFTKLFYHLITSRLSNFPNKHLLKVVTVLISKCLHCAGKLYLRLFMRTTVLPAMKSCSKLL